MKLDCGIIDLQLNIYEGAEPEVPVPRELLRDGESLRAWPSLGVVEYMYGSAGDREEVALNPENVVKLMDEWGIDKAQITVYPSSTEEHLELIDSFGDRFFATLRLKAHDGYGAVKALSEMAGRYPWIRSASVAAGIMYPQIPPNSKEYYPIYSKCIDLDIPVMLNVGFPGPRIPSQVQDPMYIEEVAWFFPELKIVMKHGGEPWPEICVRLLKKWPNLYYATTAFAPKRYPKEVVRYLQTSGSKKVLYGGYFPSLSLERIMGELAAIELPDEHATRFLRDNSIEVFGLDAEPALGPS